jgi:hypothetical protein
MTGRQIVRVLLYVLLAALVAFSFLWIAFAVGSSRAWRAGETALAAGNEVEAQAQFERSIRSHCPFNVWGRRSAARLEAMAEGYDKAGNVERAISAYESLMTSLAAIDTGWSPSRRRKTDELEQKVLSLRREAGERKDKPVR